MGSICCEGVILLVFVPLRGVYIDCGSRPASRVTFVTAKVTKTMAPIRHPAGAPRYSQNRGSAELAYAQTAALLISVLLRCSVAYKSRSGSLNKVG